jgi:hypothetical protein
VLLNTFDKEERIIEFVSHKFSPQASKWSTIEQEAFSIYYRILHFQHYLWGHHFFLQTDHRNLLWLNKAASPKVIRWRLRLQEFNFTIIHIPGKTNIYADYFSRINVSKLAIMPLEEMSDILSRYHNSVIGHHGTIRTLKILLRDNIRWYNETRHHTVHRSLSSLSKNSR